MSLVKNEKIEANKVEIHLSIDAKTFSDEINKIYKKESKNFSIHGFRKGKAPRNLVEKMYGEDMFYQDAINELLPAEYDAAMTELNLEPVDRPEVEIVSADKENGVEVKMVITVKPEVKVGEYKGLAVEKNSNKVNEDDVDAEIKRRAERNSRTVTSEEAAKEGDVANINFEGFVDDVAFEGGKGENFDLTLGSGQFIPGFEDQIVGHKAGDELDVNVTFPEQYQPELAGKAAVFKCKVNEVKTVELPEIDDEFVKDISEFETLEELKADIRKGLQEQLDRKVELDLENDLIDQVIETMEADIPEVMFETRVDEMIRDFEMRLQQQGLQLDMYLQYTGGTQETFRASYKEQAEKQVKIRLALEKIVELESLVAEEADVDSEINRMAELYKMEADKVRSLVPIEEVKKDIAVNKAIDLIKASAVITEKE